MQPVTTQNEKFGSPIHSFLVHFPVGLWLTSFLLDVIALVRPIELLTQSSTVLMWVGVIFAVPSAWFGWMDYTSQFRTMPPGARSAAKSHMGINLFLMGWYLVSASLRSFRPAGFGYLTGFGFLMSLVGFTLLLRSARLGSRLVYQYQVGRPQPEERPETRGPGQRVA